MKCTTTQNFGGNANPLYAGYGLKGHPGTDIACGYGTDILCPCNGVVYKIIDDKHPANDGTGYWAIFIITEFEGNVYEYCVGHVSRVDVAVGEFVSMGKVIGAEGNHGEVYAGGVKITKEMQDAGDKRGSHRHHQLRLLNKTKFYDGKKPKLTQYPGGAYIDKDGFNYEIPLWTNGYNGCVDCQPMLTAFDKYWATLPEMGTSTSTPVLPNPVVVEDDLSTRQHLMLMLLSLKVVLLRLLLIKKQNDKSIGK
jgi:murein DD-endopeptidase MepM/ murein hydrolase activator NlpD